MLSKVTMNFGKCASCLIECKGFKLVISFFFSFWSFISSFSEKFSILCGIQAVFHYLHWANGQCPKRLFLCQAGLWSLILNPFACPLHPLSGKKTALELSVSQASILPFLVLFHQLLGRLPLALLCSQDSLFEFLLMNLPHTIFGPVFFSWRALQLPFLSSFFLETQGPSFLSAASQPTSCFFTLCPFLSLSCLASHSWTLELLCSPSSLCTNLYSSS